MPGVRGKNVLLALLSLVFYAFGGLGQLPALLGCALWTWGFGRILALDGAHRKAAAAAGIAGVLALLGFYKYTGFLLSQAGLGAAVPKTVLPLGISFFTFHAVSYLADV